MMTINIIKKIEKKFCKKNAKIHGVEILRNFPLHLESAQ